MFWCEISKGHYKNINVNTYKTPNFANKGIINKTQLRDKLVCTETLPINIIKNNAKYIMIKLSS